MTITIRLKVHSPWPACCAVHCRDLHWASIVCQRPDTCGLRILVRARAWAVFTLRRVATSGRDVPSVSTASGGGGVILSDSLVPVSCESSMRTRHL